MTGKVVTLAEGWLGEGARKSKDAMRDLGGVEVVVSCPVWRRS